MHPSNDLRIAFLGQMRAGKDTAAEMCIARYGGEIMKFAQPLYDIQDYIYRRTHQPQGKKDRLLLQWLGTEWGRTINPDLWVSILTEDLKTKTGNLYITDCRFKNEVQALRDNGFKLFRVERPDEERIKAGASLMTHASERDLDDFDDYDAVLNNSTDYWDLDAQIVEEVHQNYNLTPTNPLYDSLIP